MLTRERAMRPNSSVKTIAILGLLATGCFLGGAEAQLTVQVPPNCGVGSLIQLLDLLDRPLNDQQIAALSLKYPQESVSLADIKQVASEYGVSLIGLKATLEEVIELDRPCIVHLQNPSHFVVLVDRCGKWVRLIDHSELQLVEAEELERRMSGYALTADQLAGDHARAKFETTHFEFGVMGAGQTIQHAFALTNAGAEKLILSVEAGSCACTALVQANNSTLEPGQRGQIQVTFHTLRAGNTFQGIAVKTNDPLRPKVLLTMRGTLLQGLELRPDKIFLNLPKQSATEVQVDVKGPPEMKIKSVSLPVAFIEAGFRQVGEDEYGKRWQVDVQVKNDAPIGDFDTVLILETTHPQQPLIRIPITGKVHGELQVNPGTVFFGFLKPGDQPQKEVVVSTKTGKSFHIRQISTENPRIYISALTALSPSSWKFSVAIDTSEKRFIEDKITIETDVEREEKLILPVTAHVKE